MGIFQDDEKRKKRKFIIRLKGGEFVILGGITREQARERIEEIKKKFGIEEFSEFSESEIKIMEV